MKLFDLLYEKNICLSIPHCQIFLHRIQIWNKDASALPEKKIRLQFFIAEAFSATLFCPVPKFQQFCKPQIIKFISCSKTDQKKGNAHLFFKVLHKDYLMLMYILKRESVCVAFFCVKTDRDPLHCANVIDGTLLIKIRQRNMSGCLININGSDWSRDFLDQSPFSKYFSLVRLINSSKVEPLKPREFHVAISISCLLRFFS